MDNLEHSVLRFFIFLAGTSFTNYSLYELISRVLGTRESRLGFFAVLNLGVFCFLFWYGKGGIGRDAPAFIPPLLCLAFWMLYYKPKPPKRRRRKVRIKTKARTMYTGVCGLPPGAPA